MIDLVVCEFIKLKRSKMFLLSLVGAVAAPLLCFIAFLSAHAKDPGPIQYLQLLRETSFCVVYITAVPLYGVITTYLFNREYDEKTLENLLTIPVSRANVIVSKWILLSGWIMTLTLISWLGAVLFGLVGPFENPSLDIVLSTLGEFAVIGTAFALLATPVIWVTLYFKNYLATVVFAVVTVMTNVMVANSEYKLLFPWSAVLNIARGDYLPVYAPGLSWLVIGLVALVGLVVTLVYFNRVDIH